jgi:hypothetical protein
MPVKIKQIIPKKQKEDIKEINEMFEQITGSADADLEVIAPKIADVKNSLKTYCKALQILETQMRKASIDDKDINTDLKEIKDHYTVICKAHHLFIKDENGVMTDKFVGDDTQNSYFSMTKPEVNELYKTLKNDQHVVSCVKSSGYLKKRYAKHLMDKDNISDSFVKNEPGVSLYPFPFSKFDIKQLWIQEKVSSLEKKLIITVLHKVLISGIKIYNVITSPDIDIKKYSGVLVDSIKGLKKQIPGCEAAFKLISNSVGMLENNFDNYYKDSIVAGNPGMIMENFVLDIAKKQKAGTNTVLQFSRIISELRKRFGNNTDPRVSKLLSTLNKQIGLLDGTQNDDEKNIDDLVDEEQTTNALSSILNMNENINKEMSDAMNSTSEKH